MRASCWPVKRVTRKLEVNSGLKRQRSRAERFTVFIAAGHLSCSVQRLNVAKLIVDCIIVTIANDDNLYALVNNQVADTVFTNVDSAHSWMSAKVFTVVWKWFLL
jgi:hypothetical protein